MQYESPNFESPSVEAFIERAVQLSMRGYTRLFTGEIPEHASTLGVDAKMTGKYGLRKLAKATRARRKARGMANLFYFRHERFFIVMATDGVIESRPGGEDPWRSLFERPLVYGPYELLLRREGGEGEKGRVRPHVRIREEVFRNERAYLLDLATRRNEAYLETVIWNLPYNAYAPVRAQIRQIVEEMNERRDRRGFVPLSFHCIRFFRARPKHLVGMAQVSPRAA